MTAVRLSSLAARLIVLIALVSLPARATDYRDSGVRMNDGKWLQLNLLSMHHGANAFGPTYNNTYLEVEGGARSGVLDLYYFFDVNEIFGWGTHRDEAGDFFTKIVPRFSIDGITRRDLAVGPVKEWYVATRYKGFNGGEYYYVGLGTDWRLKKVDMLEVMVWPKWLRTDGSNDFHYTGVEASVVWYKTLCQLPWESNLSYQGWMDCGFANNFARKDVNGTSTEFQMHNGIYWNKGHFSLSGAFKIYRNLTYHHQLNSNANTWFIGAHYRL